MRCMLLCGGVGVCDAKVGGVPMGWLSNVLLTRLLSLLLLGVRLGWCIWFGWLLLLRNPLLALVGGCAVLLLLMPPLPLKSAMISASSIGNCCTLTSQMTRHRLMQMSSRHNDRLSILAASNWI